MTLTRACLARRIREIADIQCRHGNWDYDPYMHGLANGLLLAISIVSGEEPHFLDAPAEWLADKPTGDAPVAEEEAP